MGVEETDPLVSLVIERWPDQELYGAKITGGGSVGTMAILAMDGSEAVQYEISEIYAVRTGLQPDRFL